MKLYLVTIKRVWGPEVVQRLAFRKEQVIDVLEKQGYRIIGWTCTEDF